MVRGKTTETLRIWMNGVPVAKWSPQGGVHELLYESQWVNSTQGRPLSLSLPFLPGNASHKGVVVRSYFENLLPDRLEVRQRLRERFRAASPGAFDLLAEIGRDCIGAVQLLPLEAEAPQVQTITGAPLNEEAIVRQLDIAGGLPFAGIETDDFRISMAGAQEKTAFLWHDNQWQKPLGATPSTHIFKLPLGVVGGRGNLGAGSVENEWICSRIVEAYGLPVAKSRMARFGHHQVLIVERFDRRLSADCSWWMRLPVEDFCQAKGLASEKKYEAEGGPGIDSILSTLEGSESPEIDRFIFFKAQIVFWLLAASDGHAKNFSIFLGPGGRFHLAPLYDILSMYPWMGNDGPLIPAQKLKMAMAVRSQNTHYHWSSIQRRHWENVARKNGLLSGFSQLVSEMVERTPEVIETVKNQLPPEYPSHVAQAIFTGLRQTASKLIL